MPNHIPPDRTPTESPKVSETTASHLFARASELDAAERAGYTVDELRAAAEKAGISADAFQSALAEHEEQAERGGPHDAVCCRGFPMGPGAKVDVRGSGPSGRSRAHCSGWLAPAHIPIPGANPATLPEGGRGRQARSHAPARPYP